MDNHDFVLLDAPPPLSLSLSLSLTQISFPDCHECKVLIPAQLADRNLREVRYENLFIEKGIKDEKMYMYNEVAPQNVANIPSLSPPN